MFKGYLIAGYTALCLMAAVDTISHAQAPAPEDVQQLILKNVQSAVERTIGAQNNSVEIKISSNVLIVSRVNSNMNESTHGGRNNEATAIALVVSKVIVSSPEFKTVHTIRVRYLVRPKSGEIGKVLDTVDFRKDPNGTFQFHAT